MRLLDGRRKALRLVAVERIPIKDILSVMLFTAECVVTNGPPALPHNCRRDRRIAIELCPGLE